MRAKLLCLVAIAALWAWLFGAVLVQGRVLSFRDIAHYYRPLWQWTTSEWSAGRVPLWNSLDGLGMPTHADPTASLFYPGQLLFALPLDFTTRLNLYVALHVLLAAATLYYAARGLGAAAVGAAAGAMSYAFGGQVLFQYCNPIYLVSAAWLPLAVLATYRMLTARSWRWASVLAVSLALMVLGGDPQMAYHVVLLACLYGWLQSGAAGEESVGPTCGDKAFLSRWGLLLGAVAFAGLLAAIQILPTAQWSAHSARAAFDQPRSVWEVATYLYQVQTAQRQPLVSTTADIAAGLFASPPENTHAEHVYEFSIGPWRWLEFLWPNIGGKMFPIHQRWMSGLPAEGRIWTPTLYLGLVPLLVALSTFSLRRKTQVTTQWLSWLVVLGIVGSLGAYGLGWLARELTGGAAVSKSVGAPVGGLYWFFVVLLPGYVQFRYPAKLMVFAALGLSLLAARGWEAFCQGESGLWRRVLIGLSAVSFLLLGTLWLLQASFATWLTQHLLPEFPFGAFDAPGGLQVVLLSFGHTAILSLVVYACIRQRKYASVAAGSLLALTVIDLGAANGWLIASSPAAALASVEETRAHELPNGETAVRWYRTDPLTMTEFITSLPSSAERLDQLLMWERASLAERWYLAANVNVVDAATSIEPLDMEALVSMDPSGRRYYPARAALAIDGELPAQGTFGGAVNPRGALLSPAITHPQPRAYFPQHVEVVDSPTVSTPASIKAITQTTLNSPALVNSQQDRAIIEDRSLASEHRLLRFDTSGATCRVTRYEHQEVEIDVESPQAALLVLADYYSPDWIAEIVDPDTGEAERTPIYRTNRVLRGVLVPAGKHQVIFRYRPWRFYVGLAMSAIAWGSLLALFVGCAQHTSSMGTRLRNWCAAHTLQSSSKSDNSTPASVHPATLRGCAASVSP